MAITAAQIQFRSGAGAVLINGKLGNLFGNALVGGPTSYAALEVRNNNADLTLSTVKAWMSVDTRGGQFAIAYDSAAGITPNADAWPMDTDPSTLTYSSPTTKTGGLTLGNLAPSTKARIWCRRILTGATAASPENNRVWVGGTSPL